MDVDRALQSLDTLLGSAMPLRDALETVVAAHPRERIPLVATQSEAMGLGDDLAASFDNQTIDSVARLIELHLRFFGYSEQAWTDSAVRLAEMPPSAFSLSSGEPAIPTRVL